MSCTLLDGNKPARDDVVYELPKSLVTKWFKTGRYGRMGTIGDGSCFFHSLCQALDMNGYAAASHARRKEISKALRHTLSYMFTEKDYKELQKTMTTESPKSFQEIKKMLSETATWADEIMIKWASKTLNANIIFMNLGNNVNTVYCGVHDKNTAQAIKRCKRPDVPTVVVAWVDHSHFELVVRLDDIGQDTVTVRKAFSPLDANDLETIQNVMSSYTFKCNI